MIVGDDLAQRLLDHPTEGLTVALKRWLDPTTPDDVAKIVIGREADDDRQMSGRERETGAGRQSDRSGAGESKKPGQRLVSRFRSSYHCAARWLANFGNRDTGNLLI